ncbi:unnamed protein product [Malus baccata var. baccata]
MTSPVVKIEGLLGMLTMRLQDDNFATWVFQFRSVLEGYDLFDYFDGTNVCPPKYVLSLEEGVTKEITEAYLIEYVVGSKTASEAWANLTDRYATVSRARINHLKTELHTIKKGHESIEKYLLRLKSLKDQLLAAGERVSDNDLIVAALAGLPSEYNMIKTVIVAQESSITLKEFRAQLLSAEKTAEESQSSLQLSMTGMFCQRESSQTGANRHFYRGESSNIGAQHGFQSNGFGFVGHSQRSNGNGPTGGHFSQGSIPHQFPSNRHNGGFNGQRYNSRPRFNGGHGNTNRGNRGFSGNGGFSGSNQF